MPRKDDVVRLGIAACLSLLLTACAVPATQEGTSIADFDCRTGERFVERTLSLAQSAVQLPDPRGSLDDFLQHVGTGVVPAEEFREVGHDDGDVRSFVYGPEGTLSVELAMSRVSGSWWVNVMRGCHDSFYELFPSGATS